MTAYGTAKGTNAKFQTYRCICVFQTVRSFKISSLWNSLNFCSAAAVIACCWWLMYSIYSITITISIRTRSRYIILIWFMIHTWYYWDANQPLPRRLRLNRWLAAYAGTFGSTTWHSCTRIGCGSHFKRLKQMHDVVQVQHHAAHDQFISLWSGSELLYQLKLKTARSSWQHSMFTHIWVERLWNSGMVNQANLTLSLRHTMHIYSIRELNAHS